MIKKLGKFLAEKKLLKNAFLIEVIGFVGSGFLLGHNLLLSVVLFVFACFWAFAIGEGIKYQMIKNGN